MDKNIDLKMSQGKRDSVIMKRNFILSSALVFSFYLSSSSVFSMGQKPQEPVSPPKPKYASIDDCVMSKIREKWAQGPFDAKNDAFSFANFPNGNTGTANCWGWSSLQRKFYYYAKFNPAKPPITDSEMLDNYIHAVAKGGSETEIPGYANLYEFSKANEARLKEWVHREWLGHVIPNGWPYVGHILGAQMGSSKREVAQRAIASLQTGVKPLFLMFNEISSNHVIMIISHKPQADGSIIFWVSDSNHPGVLRPLNYYPRLDQNDGAFIYPKSGYDTDTIRVDVVSGYSEIVGGYRQECSVIMNSGWNHWYDSNSSNNW